MIPDSYKVPSTQLWCLETPPLCFMSMGPLPFWYQNRSAFPDRCSLGVDFLSVVIFFISFQLLLFPGSETHNSTSNSYSSALNPFTSYSRLVHFSRLSSQDWKKWSICVVWRTTASSSHLSIGKHKQTYAAILKNRVVSGVPVSRCPCLRCLHSHLLHGNWAKIWAWPSASLTAQVLGDVNAQIASSRVFCFGVCLSYLRDSL